MKQSVLREAAEADDVTEATVMRIGDSLAEIGRFGQDPLSEPFNVESRPKRDGFSAFPRALAVADLVALLLAFASAQFAFGRDAGGFPLAAEPLIFLVTLPGWFLLAHLYDLYDRDSAFADHSTPDELSGIFQLTISGTWLYWISLWIGGFAAPEMPTLVVFWLSATVLVSSARATARTLARRQTIAQNVVILGAGETGQQVALKFIDHPEYGKRVLCLVDREPKELRPELADLPVLSRPEALWDVVCRIKVHRVILAFSTTPDQEMLDTIGRLRLLHVHVDIVPRLFELMGPGADLHAVGGLSLLHLPPISHPHLSRIKRTTDILLSALGLSIALPGLLLIAVAIKLDSGGPIFYRSDRVGANGRPFWILKFRTMYEGAALADLQSVPKAAKFQKTPDDPRVTRVGGWLRRTSLDELPQLLDVLRGKLSLVGPRPITMAEFDAINNKQDAGNAVWTGVYGYWQVLGVRPGLTGLWQINGRSDVDYFERVRLDKVYLTNWSFKLDALIIAKTLRTIVSRTGAY